MLLRIILTFMVSVSYLTSLSAGFSPKPPPSGYYPTVNYLKNPSYHPGFFSAFFTVIGFLEAVEKNERNGYQVDFEDQGNYYEPSKGYNWWCYYFKPLSKTFQGDFDVKVVKEEEKTYFSFNTLNHQRTEVKALIDKYIEVNATVKDAVDQFLHDIVDNTPLIGVNYQRPERVNNANKNFSTFYAKIDGLLLKDEYDNAKIFVSTDDEFFLDEMIDRYGSKVVYRDVPRGNETQKPTYLSFTPNYDRGFDEIVDCLLLSKCGAIVRTNSHMSVTASFFNPECEIITVRVLALPRARQTPARAEG